MIDAIDTYYKYVKDRILAQNANRKVLGHMDAQDWPPENVSMEAFYLLTLHDRPAGKQAYSASSPFYIIDVQWVWMIAGTDLQAGIKGRNRGDRHRTNYFMKEELRKGHFPGFTEKLHITTPNNVITFNSYDPKQYIRWTPLELYQRTDKESGLVYGSGKSQVTTVTEEVLA